MATDGERVQLRDARRAQRKNDAPMWKAPGQPSRIVRLTSSLKWKRPPMYITKSRSRLLS
jgi:hypothetical protein